MFKNVSLLFKQKKNTKLLSLFTAAVCSPPEDGNNTKLVEKDVYYEVGDNYTYECKKYYMYDGDRVSTCLSNLTWSLSPPACIGKANNEMHHCLNI